MYHAVYSTDLVPICVNIDVQDVLNCMQMCHSTKLYMEGSAQVPCPYRGSFCTKLSTEVPKYLAVTLTVPDRHHVNSEVHLVPSCYRGI